MIPVFLCLVALFIVNTTSWWAFRTSTQEIQHQFRENLLTLGQTISSQINQVFLNRQEYATTKLQELQESDLDTSFDGLNLFLKDISTSREEWLRTLPSDWMKSLVPDKAISKVIHDLYLLDSQGGVISSYRGDLVPNSRSFNGWNIHPLLIEDASAIISMLSTGLIQTTGEKFEDGLYVLSLYVPILDSEAGISGGLGIRANLLFADQFRSIRRGLLFASLSASALVMVLFILIWNIWTRIDRAEQKLLHQQHLANLGEMVSIVAHEIRNPLGIIEKTAEVLARKYGKDHPDQLLEYIPEEVDRLNRIVDRFLDFARPFDSQIHEDASCQLQPLVRKVVDEYQDQLVHQQITCHLNLQDTPPVSGLDSDLAHQLLTNLLKNALEATPVGGQVGIGLSQSGFHVLLEVWDTGCGMSAEQLQKATTAFFTTKEKGSGLGLAIVNKIVGYAGGQLRIDSQIGQGTKIIVSFNC